MEQELQELRDRVAKLENTSPSIPFEQPDLTPIQLLLFNKNIYLPVRASIYGTDAATAANYGNIFICASNDSWEVVSITEVHGTAGSDGSAVTLSVEKCASAVAPGSGVDLLSTAFNLKATADTPQYGSLTATKRDLLLTKGDRLILKDTGTLADVADVNVSIILRRL